jgi:Flp pilus assembly protein TadD
VTYTRPALFLIPALLLAHQSTTPEQRAVSQIQNGDSKSASLLLQQELRLNPKRPELWNLLGIAETELGRLDPARNAFEKGLSLAPDSVSLHENIGLLLYRQNDYSTAKQYLRRALELGSQKPGVRFSLAASELRTGEQRESLLELNRLEPALKDVSDYWEERGRAELLVSPAQAEVSFGRALRLKPQSLVALNGAAAAAEKQGLDEKALAYLIQARRADSSDVATLAHFGEVCIRRDLAPDARDALAKAHEIEPSNNSVLYLFARANIALENWQQAYDLFDQLSKRVPTFAPAYYAMGWLDEKLNRARDERLQLQHALSLSPSLAGPRIELAKLDLSEGDLEPAEELLNNLLKHDPNNAEANMMLGDIMARRGRPDVARTLLEQAVHQDPELQAAHYKLAILYFRRHEPEQAEREQSIAANLNAEAVRANKTQLRLLLPDVENVH